MGSTRAAFEMRYFLPVFTSWHTYRVLLSDSFLNILFPNLNNSPAAS